MLNIRLICPEWSRRYAAGSGIVVGPGVSVRLMTRRNEGLRGVGIMDSSHRVGLSLDLDRALYTIRKVVVVCPYVA